MRRRLLLLLLPILLMTACGSSSDSAAPAPPGASGCADVTAPGPKDAAVSAPSGSLAAGKTYVVALVTSCGRIDIQLDQAKNPKTANAFAHLAREGYYAATTFHRVVTGFVVQGGDPAGNGTGGPPWKVTEAPASDTRYTKGIVAMAKGGDEPAGTSGSQFFIVTGDDAGLPPDYAVAGHVVAGQDVVALIEAQGVQGSDGPPQNPVVITSATVTEK